MNIAIVGLGYVGLPLAINIAKHLNVIGFDINEQRISELKQGLDGNNEIMPDVFKSVSKRITFTSDERRINEGDVVIVCVPTPVTKDKDPDLGPLKSASATVGRNMKKGAIVVYESTTYPGCTEEVCLPILEKGSKMKLGDFHLAYSPERINPGDKDHSIERITKIISASSSEALDEVDRVYSKITKTHRVSSIKTAEAAKVIENVQRDVNIALFNELSMLFDKMKLDSKEVFAAAATKWNFIRFEPGLVGGHCIPTDPYYLATKAAKIGFKTDLILAGRKANERFPIFIADKLHLLLKDSGKEPANSSVLILGATYKADVPDTRESKVREMIERLMEKGITSISLYEPLIKADEIFGIKNTAPNERFGSVILAVAHSAFEGIDIPSLVKEKGIIIDITGKYAHLKLKTEDRKLLYWNP